MSSTEMDILGMDERQRLAWLGMIGWELGHGRTPLFLVAMVPVFALIRFGTYLLYQRGRS